MILMLLQIQDTGLYKIVSKRSRLQRAVPHFKWGLGKMLSDSRQGNKGKMLYHPKCARDHPDPCGPGRDNEHPTQPTAHLQSTTLSKNGLMAPSGKQCEDGWNKQENKQEERTREQFQRECIINTFKVCKEIKHTRGKEP